MNPESFNAPTMPPEKPKGTNTKLIIIIVVLVLCCLCIAGGVALWYVGDAIVDFVRSLF